MGAPRTAGAAAILAMAFAIALPGPATAKTCSDVSVSARGEQARYVWLAKTKARANWRQRVRGMSGLGSEYSNFSLAETSEERCLTGPSGTVCVLSGYPCRP